MPLTAAPTLATDFAAAMARLGPFEPRPALAAAVSGGPDSLALALLARDWVAAHGGTLTALVVDHGLRESSAAEASLTLARLAGQGIAARLIPLTTLAHGPGLAARARTARYAALEGACAAAGILHMLLGHHARDQAETLRMRAAAGSGPHGLAGMAALTEGEAVRRLRPLLAVPPGRLRALLRQHDLEWVEDPSNRDLATLRARLRAELDDADGTGPEVAALVGEAARHGWARTTSDGRLAEELAAKVRLHPAGWAVLAGGPLSPEALSALLCTVAGRRYPVARASVAALAAQPRAATLGGARLLAAGRAGARGDWLVVREEAAMQVPVEARPGAVWDRRFRLSPAALPPAGMMLGALGGDAARLRQVRPDWLFPPDWPSAVLRTLPALRLGGAVIAVPALGYPNAACCHALAVDFRPALPLGGGAFLPI